MNKRRAIYIPFAQAVPKVATIDANYCTKLTTLVNVVCVLRFALLELLIIHRKMN